MLVVHWMTIAICSSETMSIEGALVSKYVVRQLYDQLTIAVFVVSVFPQALLS